MDESRFMSYACNICGHSREILTSVLSYVVSCVALVCRFTSHLPGGSAAGRRGGAKGGGYCILDCVFHELDQTFFVLDMMAWKVKCDVLCVLYVLSCMCALSAERLRAPKDIAGPRMATVGSCTVCPVSRLHAK